MIDPDQLGEIAGNHVKSMKAMAAAFRPVRELIPLLPAEAIAELYKPRGQCEGVGLAFVEILDRLMEWEGELREGLYDVRKALAKRKVELGM